MENMDFDLFNSFQLKVETTEVETEVGELEFETENKISDFILTFPPDFLDL